MPTEGVDELMDPSTRAAKIQQIEDMCRTLHGEWLTSRKEIITSPSGLASVVDIWIDLPQGTSTFGSDASNTHVLPVSLLPSCPGSLGSITVDGTNITFHPARKVPFSISKLEPKSKDQFGSGVGTSELVYAKTLMGKGLNPIGDVTLDATTAILSLIGNIEFRVGSLPSGETALLFWDGLNSRVLSLRSLPHLPAYPFDPAWICPATYKPNQTTKGGTISFYCPSTSTSSTSTTPTLIPCTLHTSHSFSPTTSSLPIAFTDPSLSPATIAQYGARLVLARAPDNYIQQIAEKGEVFVFLDFNRATNPLSAFTPFWPAVGLRTGGMEGNVLPVEVRAGEIMPEPTASSSSSS